MLFSVINHEKFNDYILSNKKFSIQGHDFNTSVYKTVKICRDCLKQ